jgi:NAD(P)-dependent dehydrogenase (short-subunit alcohol dehydrogenase family)
MAATARFAFEDTVALVTGASGALGSAVVDRLAGAGAHVAATDVVPPAAEDSLLDPGPGVEFHEGDFTDEAAVERVVADVVDEHGRLDHLVNVAGTWRGGTPVHETGVDTFDMLFDVNLKTMFLASKHALPHLRETGGGVVSVSARASLEGGEGDGPYRAAKAGVRILTESIAAENRGTVRANAVMPSVIDTPANREMMPDADHDAWVDPGEIATVVAFLLSDAAAPTSGAAVPVYGEA